MASNLAQRTFARDRSEGLDTVPAEALRFDAGRFEFAAPAGKSDNKSGNVPVKMRARSAQPIEHWYWGKVVHDMAGFRTAAPKLPIDYNHDRGEVLGFLDQFTAGNDGLDVAGELVSFQPDDRTAEVIYKGNAGVPYQASISFDGDTCILEVVPDKMQATVNGSQFQGPGVIIREWELRGVAVCPYGYDPNTSTQFAAQSAGDVHVAFKEPIMDPAKPVEKSNVTSQTELAASETKPAAVETKPGETQTVVVDPRAEFKATLEKFTAKFGPANGAAWAAEGISYEQGLERHTAALSSELAASQTENKTLAGKLSAVPRGEADPVSFSEPGGKSAEPKGTGDLKFKLGENLARVAAGIKLPSRK